MSERSKRWGGLVKGKGPRLPLGSLRLPTFFAKFFTAEPGPRLVCFSSHLQSFKEIERRSHYVTSPQWKNFWTLDNLTNRKRHFKSEVALFQISSILFNFILFVECWRNILGLNPKKLKDAAYLIFNKRKRKYFFVLRSDVLHKAGA